MLPVFYWVLPSFTGFYRVLPSFTRLYWVSLSFTGFYRVLPSFAEFLMGSTGFYWVLLGFTGFYWVVLGFEWFELVQSELELGFFRRACGNRRRGEGVVLERPSPAVQTRPLFVQCALGIFRPVPRLRVVPGRRHFAFSILLWIWFSWVLFFLLFSFAFA